MRHWRMKIGEYFHKKFGCIFVLGSYRSSVFFKIDPCFTCQFFKTMHSKKNEPSTSGKQLMLALTEGVDSIIFELLTSTILFTSCFWAFSNSRDYTTYRMLYSQEIVKELHYWGLRPRKEPKYRYSRNLFKRNNSSFWNRNLSTKGRYIFRIVENYNNILNFFHFF